MRVLVTGAAGGIGAAAVTALESRGHSVIRHDVRDGPLVDLAGDLMSEETLHTVADACNGERVDAVVAAHGVAGAGELVQVSGAEIHRIMRVNTLSVLRLFAATREGLMQRDGTFVSVSSQAGLDGEAQNGIYSASKFALVGWARGVAAAGDAPRMRVVCPGMTETPLLVRGLTGMAEDEGVAYEDLLGRRLGNLPSGRLGRPSEVGRAIAWLTELSTRGPVVAAVTGGETFE